MDYEKELQVAIAAVREAAGLCRQVQSQITPDVLEKKDRSPVTVADFGSQALVCRTLREAFPEDPIIAEEDAATLREGEQAELAEKVVARVAEVRDASSEQVLEWIDYGGASAYSDRFWTLDPIDGTKGFLRGEQYAIALALIVEGEPVVAALCCPNLPTNPELGLLGSAQTGCIFSAIRGGGASAHVLDDPDAAPVTVRVSETVDTRQARFCESVESGHSDHGDAAKIAEQLSISAEPVRLDSQAKYAVVARGEADIYLRLPTRPGYVEKIWDHAAGVRVVQEAGGIVTDITGAPLDFSQGSRLEKNRGVIVTNHDDIHEQVLAAISEIGI